MINYEFADALARELSIPELTTADYDEIIRAAERAVQVTDAQVAGLVGYLLGWAQISPGNCETNVARVINV